MQIHEPDVIAQNNRPGAVTGPQLPHYCYWLMQQGFSIETQRAYKSRVKLFLSYLSEKNLSAPCFQQQEIWTEVVDQFKQYLINELGLVSRTVNAILTAMDNFSQFLEIKPPAIGRERNNLDHEAKVLSRDEQAAFLNAIEQHASVRDKAIALLIFYGGLRISECAALDLKDWSDSRSEITIRQARSSLNFDRTLSVPDQLGQAILAWLELRYSPSETALFVNHSGKRITKSSIDLALRNIGWKAHLQVSSRILRDTCLMNIASHASLIEVARIAGYTNVYNARRHRPGFVLE